MSGRNGIRGKETFSKSRLPLSEMKEKQGETFLSGRNGLRGKETFSKSRLPLSRMKEKQGETFVSGRNGLRVKETCSKSRLPHIRNEREARRNLLERPKRPPGQGNMFKIKAPPYQK